MQERLGDTPFWMQGNFAPVKDEATAADLPVEGAIPPELRGLYVRNGANPREGQSGYWFLGDGMVHGVSIRDGKAEWYRNRWVRTPIFEGEPRTPMSAFDIRYSLANTNVMAHSKRILALVENALPMELTRDLDTAGFNDFGGALKTPCTAHPKICPETGEMHFFGYRVLPPFLTYHVADAGGNLLRSMEIPVKGGTMIHDFALTSGHVVFMDLPVVFDLPAAMGGASMPFRWSDDYGARLGVLPRGAGVESLRWVDVEPCYVYHVANAFETAEGAIVLDVARYEEHWRGGPPAHSFDTASLTRWTIAPGAAKASEQRIDERTVEFPRINDARTGKAHTAVYALATHGTLASGVFTALLKYDLKSGRVEENDFGGTGLPSEFTMVPSGPDAGEDEGWLLGFVYDRARGASDFVIFDAQRVSAKPVAKIALPRRVPQGFHGSWIAD
ncbi:MAG: carotenoid oxygenase family protein [Rhodomicrobium sp.]